MSDEMNLCQSCAAPRFNPDFKGASDLDCKHCTDPEGKLVPREQVQKGVVQWFLQWHPGIDESKAMARADLYLQAMPAWAQD